MAAGGYDTNKLYGATNHNATTCRFREYICSKCPSMGYLGRVCPEQERRESTSQGKHYHRRGGQQGDFYFGDAVCSSEEDDVDIEENLNF